MAEHYDVLGVAQTSSADEIKKAYRKLARQYHPDTNPGDAGAEAKFKDIANAYEVLGDGERRQRYDRFGDDGLGGQGGQQQSGAGDISDLFGAFFGGNSPFGGGGQRGPSGPPRGADLEASVSITLEDVVAGTTEEVEVRTAVACEPCEGTGSDDGTTATCTQCGGAGAVRQMRQSILGQMVSTVTCDRCGGLGTEIATPCSTCGGEGREIKTKTYTVEVPQGVDHGTTLRLTGRGAAGVRGGAHGDLYVHIQVAPHKRFHRDGVDLVEDLHVPMTQASLGAKFPYLTIDGETELEVRPGAGSGDVLTVRNAGVPSLRGRGRGHLRVRLVVDTPTDLTDEEDALLRELAERRGEQVAEKGSKWVDKIRSAFT